MPEIKDKGNYILLPLDRSRAPRRLRRVCVKKTIVTALTLAGRALAHTLALIFHP